MKQPQRRLSRLGRTLMSPIRGTHGFSLVEVMIAGAITLGLALAISSLLVMMNRQQAVTKEKADAHLLLQQIAHDLKNKPVSP